MLSRTFEVIRNRGRKPALLLVDDEPTDRLAIEEALLRAGHRVVAEGRADRAADLLRNTAYPLTALITAVELHADHSGWELANLARELRPTIAVIYLTRYSEGAWPARGVRGSRLIQKPTDAAKIVCTLKALLKRGCGDAREPVPS